MTTDRLAYTALALLALVSFPGTAAALEGEGRAWGDIHIRTMDGASYDFQSAGEFVASSSSAGDFDVQIRLESSGFSSNISILTGVAVLVDSTRASVVLGRDPLLHVDDKPTKIARGESLELPGGGWIARGKKKYEIYWSDGSILTINTRKSHLNAFLKPAETRSGTLTGLFGNFNGSPVDDVDATALAESTETLSGLDPRLTELARVIFAVDDEEFLLPQEASHFDYEPGKSTWSYRRPSPKREATSDALPIAWKRRAQEACEAAGVTDEILFEACLVDVGYTRDESFAETAALVQARDVTNWDSELDQQADAGN